MTVSRIVAAATVVALTGAAIDLVPRTNLTDPRARCMDGTLGAFYWQRAKSTVNATKFVIYLEGGGECATEAACTGAVNGPLGSSNYFQPAIYMPYFLNDDDGANPDWASWHHIDVPYCSQDVHSGTATAPSSSSWGLYFAGHNIVRAVLDALDAAGGLRQATDIILTGASAGGIGVWINVDYIADRYPAARVTGVPIAGFYFYAWPYTGQNHTSSTLADFRPQAWPQHYALWQSYANEACVAARAGVDPWACLLANYSYPHVRSASFVVEAQTDQTVLEAHDWFPGADRQAAPEQAYMAAWAANMTQALVPVMDPTDATRGAFNPACYIHTAFDVTGPFINGVHYQQALGDWYFNRTAPEGYKLQDDCGIECNPSCP